MSTTISEALIADYKHEAPITRSVLEAVPEDRLAWKPHEKSMSLGKLATHIAETPDWARTIMGDGIDFAAEGRGYVPFVAESRAELLETFEKHAGGFEEAVAGRDDAFLSLKWTMRYGDKLLASLPRHVVVRSTVIHHTIHHRGQLSVYLRLLGVPVPPTYGPTADDSLFP